MKVNLLCLLALTIFVSCNGQDKPQAQKSEKTIPVESNSQASLKVQKACEALPLADIAKLLGVDEFTLNQEDMSFGKGRSICYYFTKEGNRKFFIRMAWKNEKAQENKILQKKYTQYLSEGEREIKAYTEVQNTEDGQVLFGIGQDRENKYIHLLRKRYGNEAEIQVELTKENKDESAKDILMAIISGIN